MAIHVTPHNDNWQVVSQSAKKAYRVVPTQKEAIEIAKGVAKNKKTDVKVHGRNGKFRVN